MLLSGTFFHQFVNIIFIHNKFKHFQIVYSCRMCPGMVFTQVDLDNHLEKHELVNPSDRQERDDSLERRRSGQMDQKGDS